MARPKIEDARDKMYRVRVNNEEESMLQYICEKKSLRVNLMYFVLLEY
jgi:hypothetical protein